jgi:predicted enzyme related to lactoylglutathione lyase
MKGAVVRRRAEERYTMANPFVHVELNTNDVPKARKFYSALFDWKLEDVEMGPSGQYTMISPGQGTGGGILRHPDPESDSIWIAYVEVGDIQAATQKAKALGAQVMVDAREVPGAGWMSIIVDPTGATLGLWKPAPRR